MQRKLFVGDVVITIVKDLLGNEGGTKGVVYEEYDIGGGPGASIIFANGAYDGFSRDDQESMVMKIGHHPEVSGYRFHSVIKLSNDFNLGYWSSVFK